MPHFCQEILYLNYIFKQNVPSRNLPSDLRHWHASLTEVAKMEESEPKELRAFPPHTAVITMQKALPVHLLSLKCYAVALLTRCCQQWISTSQPWPTFEAAAPLPVLWARAGTRPGCLPSQAWDSQSFISWLVPDRLRCGAFAWEGHRKRRGRSECLWEAYTLVWHKL